MPNYKQKEFCIRKIYFCWTYFSEGTFSIRYQLIIIDWAIFLRWRQWHHSLFWSKHICRMFLSIWRQVQNKKKLLLKKHCRTGVLYDFLKWYFLRWGYPHQDDNQKYFEGYCVNTPPDSKPEEFRSWKTLLLLNMFLEETFSKG